MSVFHNDIRAEFDSHLADALEESLPDAVDEVVQTDGFDSCVDRSLRQEVRRFAEREFGLPAELLFEDEFDFFDRYLRQAYEVGSGNQRRGWCSRWWDHTSVRFRISSMWRAYEVMARENPATCDERFLREVGDHHMPFLLGERSPMAGCSSGHTPSQKLKSDPVEE